MEAMRGRPAKYQTVEELQAAIDGYFDECDSRRIAKKGGLLEDSVPYTIEGLCYALDIDRSTLLRYEKKEDTPEFRNTIKRAKLRIQQDVMERGLTGRSSPAMSIFNLKNNFGYVDKQDEDRLDALVPITGIIVR